MTGGVDYPGVCRNCGKRPPYQTQDCSWACSIEMAKKAGGRVFCPNGLPIKSIKSNHDMYEHEHGDHPDYCFPVTVQYINSPLTDDDLLDYRIYTGEDAPDPMTPEGEQKLRDAKSEEHALIYTDGSIAVTLYEAEHFVWLLQDGEPPYRLRKLLPTKGGYRLTRASLQLILEHYQNKESK